MQAIELYSAHQWSWVWRIVQMKSVFLNNPKKQIQSMWKPPFMEIN